MKMNYRDSKDTKTKEYNQKIQSGKYTLDIKAKEWYYEGDGGLDMATAMPGVFFDSDVVLTAISGKLSPLEQLAIPHLPFQVFEDHDEITNQPEGYGELRYKALVKKMQTSQDLVQNAIRNKVKDIL